MGYDKKFKLKIIESFNEGIYSISKVASKNNIPKQTLARWIKLHNSFGEDGLKNKKPGAKGKKINPEVEEEILKLWSQGKLSRYSMRKCLKIKNINISEWQIQKIYKKYNLIN
jgi:transposase-like protein